MTRSRTWEEPPPTMAAPEDESRSQDGNSASRTVFAGQIPFSVSAAELQRHFEAQPGIQKPVKVRLLQDKSTGKSRGMAFVELVSEADVHTALKVLHKSLLAGRRINVERTVGGGGSRGRRKERLERLRSAQALAIRKRTAALVKSIIDESAAIQKASREDEAEGDGDGEEPIMGLAMEDVDDGVWDFLGAVTDGVATEALREFALGPRRGVRSRSAYLMGILKRHVAGQEESKHDEKPRNTRGKRSAQDKLEGPVHPKAKKKNAPRAA